jgi:hypothetical protein
MRTVLLTTLLVTTFQLVSTKMHLHCGVAYSCSALSCMQHATTVIKQLHTHNRDLSSLLVHKGKHDAFYDVYELIYCLLT